MRVGVDETSNFSFFFFFSVFLIYWSSASKLIRKTSPLKSFSFQTVKIITISGCMNRRIRTEGRGYIRVHDVCPTGDFEQELCLVSSAVQGKYNPRQGGHQSVVLEKIVGYKRLHKSNHRWQTHTLMQRRVIHTHLTPTYQ